jgi:Undecaprenyl-phosphate glucose phosphotransferase
MSLFSETLYPRPSEFTRGWEAASSRNDQRWSIPYSSIPAIVIGFDVFLLITISTLTGALYSFLQETSADLARYAATAIVFAAIFVPVSHNRSLYSPSALLNYKSQVRNILAIWTMTFLIFGGVAFALKVGSDFSRGAVLLFAVVGLTVIFLHRVLWRLIIQRALDVGTFRGRKSILLCMDESPWEGDTSANIVRDLLRHGYEVVRLFYLSADASKEQLLDQVVEYTRGSDIEQIFLSADVQRWSQNGHLAEELGVLPLPLTLLPDECTAALFQRPSWQFGSTVGVEFSRAPLGVAERFLKRVLDIVCSVVGIIALLPVFFVVALAIKLDSPGPVLFMQTRHGFNGKRFKILKFRTMTVLEDGAMISQAVRGDSRVTRIGGWLRKTSLDEIPQFFNVLNGDMSVVGPRPHAVAHDNHYADLISRYAFRHHVKPGITGWAQIRGCRGETPTVRSMKERVDHDIWYIDNWSLLLDLHIIVRTVVEVMRTRNAY